MKRTYYALCLFLSLLTSCYHVGSDEQKSQLRQHVEVGYNLIVLSDTLVLSEVLPDGAALSTEATVPLLNETGTPERIVIRRGDNIAIADILTVPATDTLAASAGADSVVYVRVARDQQTIGWVGEHELLASASPVDPISRILRFFSRSDVLLAFSLVAVLFCVIAFAPCRLAGKLSHRVGSPTYWNYVSGATVLLPLLISLSAALCAYIQTSQAWAWHHFYFHPTLSPLSAPWPVSILLLLLWASLICTLAALDELVSLTPLARLPRRLFQLFSLCLLLWMVFSLCTLAGPAVLLLVLGVVAAAWYKFSPCTIRQLFSRHYARFLCGSCGAPMHSKGRCPHCGADNE